MKAYINKAKCISDNRVCRPLKQCPENAITWIEDDDELLGSRMQLDRDKCSGCGLCVDLCYMHSIECK
ncbi:MAG: 4Fe-4S binding protein [Eubacteriales bacterium]